jgi:uncharacterized protein (DUF488 family)
MNATIYTIGHSNHSMEGFLDLLTIYSITAVADVRSQPVSTYTPHFSRETLTTALAQQTISYVFLGQQLGGRSTNQACYKNGRLQYSRLAREPSFDSGISRVKRGIEQFRIALMCSEKDPLGCHRALLVGRRLFSDGINVQHILANSELEPHAALEMRLLTHCKLPEGDMFRDRNDCIADAYQIQGNRVAHADEHQLNELTRIE